MMDRPITMDELRKMAADKNYVFIIGQLVPARPGVMLFSTILEYRHFTPCTPRNDDFIPITMVWPEVDPMHWWVMRIPAKDFDLAKKVAEDSPIPMRVADGVPHIIGGGKGLERFPMSTPNCYSLENASGSIIYEPGGWEKETAREQVELETVRAEHDKWLKDNGHIGKDENVWSREAPDVIGTPALLVFASPDKSHPDDPREANIRMVLLGDYERCRTFYGQYLDNLGQKKPNLDMFLAFLGNQGGFRSPTKQELKAWTEGESNRYPIRMVPWVDGVGSDEHWVQLNMRRKR